MSDIKYLRKYAVFERLEDSDIDLLLKISKTKKFNIGEIIHYENDPIDRIYILLEGFIKVYKINRFDNEVFLYTQKTSGLINTFNLFEEGTYFSNIECMEESLALCVDFKALRALLRESQTITAFFYGELTKKIELLKHIVSREIVYDGTAKVACMIANSLDEFNSLKKQDVAYMLNIQPETLSRILTKLKREEIIETTVEGKAIIKNRDKLTAIFMQ